MATIFELSDRLREFQRFAEECEDLDEDSIRDTLESLEGELEDKLKDYAAVIKNLESDVEGMKKAEKNIATRRQAIENNIARMKSVMASCMESEEMDQIEDSRFRIGFRKNPVSVEILDVNRLPEFAFIPQDPAVDKRLLLELLRDGEKVAGARLVDDKRTFYIK